MLVPAELLPLGDRLKVLPLRPPQATKSGILMPESSQARDKPLSGLVLAIGRGRTLETGAIVPLECGELFQQALPNATLKVIEHCGHSPANEKPQEFVHVVTEFLSGLR